MDESIESRETWAALRALNDALWDFSFFRCVRVVWESNVGTPFVLGAAGARRGKWKELARVDWMRGTVEDDEPNIWWEELFLRVPALESAKWKRFQDTGRQRRRRRRGRRTPSS